mmetsp:Transcript_11058/g.50257  ORF Transcript_11058/g.50257 Transcript_11058/m.50257 type:complete len:269 (-) Transcript_11058:753-1559(-)
MSHLDVIGTILDLFFQQVNLAKGTRYHIPSSARLFLTFSIHPPSPGQTWRTLRLAPWTRSSIRPWVPCRTCSAIASRCQTPESSCEATSRIWSFHSQTRRHQRRRRRRRSKTTSPATRFSAAARRCSQSQPCAQSRSRSCSPVSCRSHPPAAGSRTRTAASWPPRASPASRDPSCSCPKTRDRWAPSPSALRRRTTPGTRRFPRAIVAHEGWYRFSYRRAAAAGPCARGWIARIRASWLARAHPREARADRATPRSPSSRAQPRAAGC